MKMLWDDGALYVGAWMQEPQVIATLKEKNSVVFQDNDFEVFLDTGTIILSLICCTTVMFGNFEPGCNQIACKGLKCNLVEVSVDVATLCCCIIVV